jgi:hypothetical protein
MDRGWSEQRQAFRQHYDSDALDASALLILRTVAKPAFGSPSTRTAVLDSERSARAAGGAMRPAYHDISQ